MKAIKQVITGVLLVGSIFMTPFMGLYTQQERDAAVNANQTQACPCACTRGTCSSCAAKKARKADKRVGARKNLYAQRRRRTRKKKASQNIS